LPNSETAPAINSMGKTIRPGLSPVAYAIREAFPRAGSKLVSIGPSTADVPSRAGSSLRCGCAFLARFTSFRAGLRRKEEIWFDLFPALTLQHAARASGRAGLTCCRASGAWIFVSQICTQEMISSGNYYRRREPIRLLRWRSVPQARVMLTSFRLTIWSLRKHLGDCGTFSGDFFA
jgi:hypothetical protein